MINRTLKTVLAASAALLLTAGLGMLAKNAGAVLTGSALSSAALSATDPLNLTEGTVVSNVFFEGQSLSGLTPEKAADICREPISRVKKKEYIIQSKLVEENCYGGSAKDVGITWDDSEVDSTLAGLVVEGTLLERYKFAKDVQNEPVEIEVSIKIDEKTAMSYFEALQELWKTDPVDASVSKGTGELIVTPGQNGLSYDFTEGIAQLVVDVLSGEIDDRDEYYIDPGETVTEPALTTERAASFTVIGEYMTNYAAPTTTVLANREQNLVQSTANMNGHCFAPGEEVSALEMYGSVTEAGGYRPAGTIAGGVHVDEVGGGICQTTTTLYNAALYAELEIVYRHNHSLLVNYVDPSRDAMVYAAGGSDFKFLNSSSDYIFIESWVDKSDQSVHVQIIGHEDHAADHTVEYQSEVLEMTMASINVVDDPTMHLGFTTDYSTKFQLASQDGSSPACKSRLWKITTDGGVENRTLVNYQDTYGSQSCTYRVAPDVKLEFTLAPNSRSSMYVSLSPYYLDGTILAWDMNAATDEEVYEFNLRMKTLMEQKGLVWPYSNNGYTDANPTGDKIMGSDASSSDDERTGEHTGSDSESESESESVTEESRHRN